eukprot:734344-Amphidinium_carterae.5
MRSRLWRCNVDQLRNAAAEEMLGAELVQQGQLRDLVLHLHSTRGTSAVDVAADGPPPTEEEHVERVQDTPSSVGLPLPAVTMHSTIPPSGIRLHSATSRDRDELLAQSYALRARATT